MNTTTGESRGSAVATAALLCGALVVHLLFVDAPGWVFDVENFGSWMQVGIEYGVAHVAERVPCIYPPGFLYLLKAVGLVWLLISHAPLPIPGSIWSRVLTKLVPCLADVTTAWVLYRLALTVPAAPSAPAGARVRRARIVMAAYAFNPAMLFLSAVWGQADSLIGLLLLPAVWAIVRRRFAWGFGLAAAAVLVKPQAGVVWPALLLLALHLGGLGSLFAAARGTALVTLVMLIPFFGAGRVESLITTVAQGASGLFPNVSLNAHNVWWLIMGAGARNMSDMMRLGNGLMTYHGLGTAMFASATIATLWRLWRALQRAQGDPLSATLEACALQVLALYLFPTEIHERYILPALVFLAALCIWTPRMWWAYGVCSIATLLSLASTLQSNYPQALGRFGMLIPLMLLRADRAETLVLSAIFVALFVVLLLWTPDRLFRRAAPIAAAVAALGIACLTVVPLHRTQLLSAWAPVEQSQGWGDLHLDRSVGGNRLTTDGFIFRHGIGTHATLKLTYHLNGDFRTFDTSFGVDDEANVGQRIRFRISADGETRFDSGDIVAFGPPHHARISVEGAQLLTLEVLDGGDGIDRDHADWLEPVLLP